MYPMSKEALHSCLLHVKSLVIPIYAFLSWSVKWFMSRRLSDDFYESYFMRVGFLRIDVSRANLTLRMCRWCCSVLIPPIITTGICVSLSHTTSSDPASSRECQGSIHRLATWLSYFFSSCKVSVIIILFCGSLHRKTAPLKGQNLCCVLYNLF